MKDSPGSVGQRAIAEDLEQSLIDAAAEVIGLDAHGHLDFQRDQARTVNLQIVPGHAEAFQVSAHRALELVIDRQAAQPIGCYEDRAPTARPAESRGGALHLRM